MSTWEERMAERTAARRLVREAERITSDAVEQADREKRQAACPHRTRVFGEATGAVLFLGPLCVQCGKYLGDD